MLKNLISLLFVFAVAKAGAQTPALDLADSLFRSGNFTQAIKVYTQLNSGYANLQVARGYSALGNYEKAVKQYELALAENPKLLLAKNELGKLLFKLSRF